jgi:hypothetical protein
MLDPIKELELRVESLERTIKDTIHILKFYGMTIEKIPSCYKKAFPKPNEYPFFEAGPFKPITPKFNSLKDYTSTPTELEIPTDPKELKKAQERLVKRLEYHEKGIDPDIHMKPWKWEGDPNPTS